MMMSQRSSLGAAATSRGTTVRVMAGGDCRQLRERVTKQRQAILQTYNRAYAVFPKVKFVLKHNSRLGECWKLSGSSPELGSWQPELSPTLSWREGGVWSCEVALPPGKYTFKCMLRTAEGSYVWEGGDNREVVVPVKDRPGHHVITYHMDVRTEPVDTLFPPQHKQGQYSPMAFPNGIGSNNNTSQQQREAFERAMANGHVPVGAW